MPQTLPQSALQSLGDLFHLTRWKTYAALAAASLCGLAVVAVKTRGGRGPEPVVVEPPSEKVAAQKTRAWLNRAAAPLAPAPRAKEPLWIDRHALIKRRAAASTDLVLLGDSITQGWEYKDRWQELFPDLPALNAGIASDRVEHVQWRAKDGLFTKVHPKVVVLLCGINNLAMHEPEKIAATQAETIRYIQARSPATKILLLAVFPTGYAVTDARRAKIARLNVRLARLADGSRVTFMDLGKSFLEADGGMSKAVTFDGIHLTAKGYRIWADAMGPKLRDLMASSTI